MSAAAGPHTTGPDAARVSPPLAAALRRALERLINAAVIVLEAWIAYAWLVGLASPGKLILAHFTVALGFISAAYLVSGILSGPLVFRSAMLFLVGPLMAVGLLTRVLAGGTERKTTADTAPMGKGSASATTSMDHDCSTQSDLLYAQIVAGRRSRRDAGNRQSLKEAIQSGDLDAQQFAVAMISQRYEPEMLSALVAALQSTTPAVRVQAAAVFAKLRERMSSEAKEILRRWDGLLSGTAGRPGPSDPWLAARCNHLAASGFVDSRTAGELRRLAELLASSVGTGTEPRPGEPAAGTSGTETTTSIAWTAAARPGAVPLRAHHVCSPQLGGG